VPEREYAGTLIVREEEGFHYVTFRPADGGGLFNLGRFTGVPDEYNSSIKTVTEEER